MENNMDDKEEIFQEALGLITLCSQCGRVLSGAFRNDVICYSGINDTKPSDLIMDTYYVDPGDTWVAFP